MGPFETRDSCSARVHVRRPASEALSGADMVVNLGL